MGALERAFQLIEKADPNQTLPPCLIKQIEIGPAAIFNVTDIVKNFIPLKSKIGLIVDKKTIFREKDDVKDLVFKALFEKFDVIKIELYDGHEELHASEEVIAYSISQSKGLSGLVSIGGGTITDIGKMTALGIGGVAHIAIQTAASVDGYTDNVSVILINGVKRTVLSRWPDALIADTKLIAEAPSLMNRAGYGEINSMFTATADWRIAALLGFEKKFHWGPIELLQGVGEGIEDWAPGLRNSDLDSIERLVNALAIRGIVTGVADTTACLSGIEHLISHMLDMYQGANHLQIGQHGAQVGVGSVYAAAIWELILIKLNDHDFSENILPNKDVLREKVYSAFNSLDSSNSLADECWRDYEKKIDFWISNINKIKEVLVNWKRHATDLKKLVKRPEEIIFGLLSSGSSVSLKDLDPVIEEHIGRWAVANCHLMRNRFVGVDLLEFLGLWNEAAINWVFNRASELINLHGVKV